MDNFMIQGTSGRFEDGHTDLREEIQLMVEADMHTERPADATPRRSLFARLFNRPAAERLAA